MRLSYGDERDRTPTPLILGVSPVGPGWDQEALLQEATRLNATAGDFYKQGRYAKAEPFLKQAVTIWEKALRSDQPIWRNH
jgi:hypothetical protein